MPDYEFSMTVRVNDPGALFVQAVAKLMRSCGYTREAAEYELRDDDGTPCVASCLHAVLDHSPEIAGAEILDTIVE